MANRNTLHTRDLEAFKEYVRGHEWEICPTHGDYEVLRIRKAKTTFIFYRREKDHFRSYDAGLTHISVPDKAFSLVQQFIASKKAAK